MVSYYNKKNHRFVSNPFRKNREKPNRAKKYPTVSFRTTKVDHRALAYLMGLTRAEKRSEFICESINTNFMLRRQNPLIVLKELIIEYPRQARHFVRVACRNERKEEDLILRK